MLEADSPISHLPSAISHIPKLALAYLLCYNLRVAVRDAANWEYYFG